MMIKESLSDNGKELIGKFTIDNITYDFVIKCKNWYSAMEIGGEQIRAFERITGFVHLVTSPSSQ